VLPSIRPVALVVHGDGDVLDLLTRLFEASGFEVLAAVSAYRGQSQLEGTRDIEVVIAPWDATRGLGGELYRWALGHKPGLRSRFVFIADEVPPEFDAVVGGRCLAVPLAALDELARIARAIVTRVRTPPRGLPVISEGPSLLVADDDAALLGAMAEILEKAGYTVFHVDSGVAAKQALEGRDFDAIVLDWHMHDTGGADIYEWILDEKPHLAARVVFLTESDEVDIGPIAPGRPMFRKGQDSQGLADALKHITQLR
jgi:CheY-like chemotaxis protein